MNDLIETPPSQTPEGSELGKASAYVQSYNPDLLYPIPRAIKRQEIGIDPDHLPFGGFDCWNMYELSWLNEKGKPLVATAEIYYDCRTPFIIESKSLKLYFNSFNHSQFSSVDEVRARIQKDLIGAVGGTVVVKIRPLNEATLTSLSPTLEGICLDDLDISCDTYLVQPNYLSTADNKVEETLYSDLLKSNCLVTHQPDWGSVQICYKGKQINREGLLRYIVSFRNHNEFHEQCIERIFIDIMNYCQPSELTVYGRYTRRGGLDINPFRTTLPYDIRGKNNRLLRQ